MYGNFLQYGCKNKEDKIRKNNSDVLCNSQKSIIFARWYQINDRLFEPALAVHSPCGDKGTAFCLCMQANIAFFLCI